MQRRLPRIWVIFTLIMFIFTMQLLISGAEDAPLPGAVGEPLGVIPDETTFEIQEQIVGDTSKESALANMIEDYRKNLGFPCMQYNDTLVTAERLHLKDMAERGYFSHNTPEGLTPEDRANNAGFDGFATESLTAGRETPEDAFNSWRASRLHNRGFFFDSKEMGIGYVYDSESDYKHYYGFLQGSRNITYDFPCDTTRAPAITNIPIKLSITQNNVARPTIIWTHQPDITPIRLEATHYAFEIIEGTQAFDPIVLSVSENGDIEASTLCTGTDCSWQVTSDLPNGVYTIFIRAWSEQGGYVWTGENGQALVFTINITDNMMTPTPVPTGGPGTELPGPDAPKSLAVIPNQGRPTIRWGSDDKAQWFNFWIIGTDGQGIPLSDAWYPSDADGVPFASTAPLKAQCAGLTCTLKPNINPVGGDYQLWMRSWGNNQLSTGGNTGYDGWSMVEFSLPTSAPDAVTGIALTATNGNDIAFTWQGAERATWYNVWVGTDGDATPPWQPEFFDWMLAEDLGCENAGVCTLTAGVQTATGAANLNLPTGEYIWYVQSWGPGGFSTGGSFDPPLDSWVEADKFTVP